MSLPLPPASKLHAILLVTQSRSLGPKLVFHYPPLSPSDAALVANKVPAWFGNQTSTASVDSTSSSSDWDSSTDNDGGDDHGDTASLASGGRGSMRTSHKERDKLRLAGGGAWGRQDTIDEDDTGLEEHGSGKGNGSHNGGDHDWNTVLGFRVDALEKMLCPNKVYNKRRFELGVESVVFLGAPMFVREDGMWKKGRRKKDKRPAKEKEEEENTEGDSAKGHDTGLAKSVVYPEGFEPGYGHGLMSGAASEAGSDGRSSSVADSVRDDMTMFNIVFVLNPPALEYQLRVKNMYEYVSRKFARALKLEQARFQYVWGESKKILNIKQRAKENGESISSTWSEIVNASPLARAIAVLFDAISKDKIAHVRFDKLSTSFQIPQADSTPYLPSAMDPQMPGLWLTTSNVAVEDDSAPMTQNAALLLLQDAETLIKELEADSKGSTNPLAFYIRTIVPTKSLLKLSIKHGIHAQDMEYAASHLVFWRRARLIAPLNPRDTYIVSPNADLAALKSAIPAYAARFPTLPSLPNMLSKLSGQPKPYGRFIPTNEHREAYMEILAWLMRGGWVTQLRTFAWVRVTPEIKSLVAQEMEREAQIKKAEEAQRDADVESLTGSMFSDKRSHLSLGRPSTPLIRPPRREDDEDMEGGRILSPNPMYRGSPARPGSDAGSTSSVRTTIPLSAAARTTSPVQAAQAQRVHRPSPLHIRATSPSVSTQPFSPSSPSVSSPPAASPPPQVFTASLVLSPQKANSLEARWLEKIGQSFEDPEVKEHWSMLLRHLDGKHALEDINSREGIKRKKLWALVGKVREMGWLVEVRHW
ncbi:hypothetical protein M011DRAFT_445416 [Sporormia fimetaria CBS 119925]|uniref:Nitrogen permease regulator 3 n=1 Tax=Sporormia fimetaria CBS 119925 TaxID=1340428 RepID=A0A6A6VAH1_9PLEO|nr:hypothetical protein M011DRAFT_445416 [Sporormia fimetaria CBS 119925]